MKQSTYCHKEKEIAEMHTDLRIVKKEVLGNGQEGLSKSVPKLAQLVDTLNKNVETNNTLTAGVLRFKDEMAGRDQGKAMIRKNNKWIIGTLIGFCTLLLGLVGLLIAVTA